VVIFGGSCIGNSIAYALSTAGMRNIAVVEADPTYTYTSAPRSAGGIRQQFSLKENILLAKYGAEFLKTPEVLRVDDDVPEFNFRQTGYLYLASTEEQRKDLIERNLIQRQCGIDYTELMDAAQLKAKFPWLKTSDLVLGSFGHKNEGYFDPWALVIGLKKKAIANGVTYIKAKASGGSVVSGPSGLKVESVNLSNGEKIQGETLVNACGVWSANFLDSIAANYSNPAAIARLPIKARKRSICTFNCQVKIEDGCPPLKTPLVIDPNGTYFRPDGTEGQFMVGKSPSAANDPNYDPEDVKQLDIVDDALFNNEMWPEMAERVPAFEGVGKFRHHNGFYEFNTLDENGIMGYHSELKNMYIAAGFSGHGLMQSPGIGRVVSEYIADGKYKTIDVSRFSFDRIINNKPVFETCII